MKLTGLACLALIGLMGCRQQANDDKKAVPIVDQARPSSSTAQIIEDMTGKTDVKAGLRAQATIRRVSEAEKKDLEEINP